MLISTYAKVARFVPLVREALAEFWPQHPPLRFLTDGGAEGPDVIRGREHAFVPLMAEGVAAIRAEFPEATHIFHMLEDHCPLRPCDEERISAGFGAALAHALPSTAFVTYPWFWYFANEMIEFGTDRLILMPKEYYRYFQLQPTLWRIDYLETILAASMRQEVTDPWAFEALRLPEAEQHYVSTYAWPTVHHGFLAQGRIHSRAIDFADRNSASRLRQALMREVVGLDSEFLYRLHRAGSWVAGLPPRLVAKVGRLRPRDGAG